MKNQRFLVKAQTALEYIAASFVFATVGIATFLLTTQGSVLSNLGAANRHGADRSVQEAISEGAGGLAQDEWPAEWGDNIAQADTATSDWNDDKEADSIGQTGQYWNELEADHAAVALPEQKNSYTSAELQSEFNDLTEDYINQNKDGYTEEDLSSVEHNLSENWFIGSDEENGE